MSGIYHSDSIRDVADSLGLHNIAESVVSLLASDVEYRLHQVIEEASRFTRHSKRTTLTTSDIDQAFRILNIEVCMVHIQNRVALLNPFQFSLYMGIPLRVHPASNA